MGRHPAKAASRKGQPCSSPITGPASQAVAAALIMSASGPDAVKASPTMTMLARINEGSSQAVTAARMKRVGGIGGS